MVFVSVFPFSQMSLQSHSTVLLAAKVTSSHSFTGSPEFFWPVSRISFSKKFYANILLKNYFAYIKYYYRKTCVLERPDASSTLSYFAALLSGLSIMGLSILSIMGLVFYCLHCTILDTMLFVLTGRGIVCLWKPKPILIFFSFYCYRL